METLARVLVDTGVFSLDKEFFYAIPDSLAFTLKVGHAVEVPFGHGTKTGIVTGFTDETAEYELKSIKNIKFAEPLVDEKNIELASFMQRQYIASLYECLRLMCPPGVFGSSDQKIRLLKDDVKMKNSTSERILAYLSAEGGEATLSALKREFGNEAVKALRALKEKNIVAAESFDKNRATALKRKYASINESGREAKLSNRARAQIKALEILKQGDIALSECSGYGITASAVKELEKKGFVSIYEAQKRRNPFSEKSVGTVKKLSPTEEQKTAIDEISSSAEKNTGETVLLHGITGSGKTEVFMQVIERVTAKGKGALVLVPEISLTPQMTDRFLGRFGDSVAILHSRLSVGERLDEWNRIKSGEAKVVIGARSAVFAPINALGIIIVDEEHENTYKSEQSPRYDTVEVAKERCRQNGAVLVLASATPSITDYYKALSGEYKLIKLTKRCNNAELPKVYVADMREELKNGNRSMLSGLLKCEIEKNLKAGEQTVLFLNRRGFSTFVSCRDCGYVALCPNCSIALTYHKNSESLNCHYCGYSKPILRTCPDCGSAHIKYFGTGTQRLEDEIKKLFPSCTLLRMDVDTTGEKNSHEKILKKFSEEKIDILLGTQMVSKGLDFPGISLVGVVAADMSLNIDDYRAAERTFDLITQVCGRAGRGDTKGRAVIQTYSPDNPVIEMAKTQNYEAFYETEIAFRKMFSYPPFSDIVCVIYSSENEEYAKKACRAAYDEFKKLSEGMDMTLYEAAPAPIEKIKGRYRWRFWMKADADEKLRGVLKEMYIKFKDKNVKMSVSVDPINMA